MIHQLWCESGSTVSASIRNVNKLTKNYFFKNNYSRMIFHLAVQLLSENVVNMIDDYAALFSDAQSLVIVFTINP